MLILDKRKAIERMLVAAIAAGSTVPEGSGQWFSSTPARRLARFEPRLASGTSRQAERRGWSGYPASVEAPPFPLF